MSNSIFLMIDVFYKQVTLVAQYDDDAQLVGHHCFMSDISARKTAELEQEDLVNRLAAS